MNCSHKVGGLRLCVSNKKSKALLRDQSESFKETCMRSTWYTVRPFLDMRSTIYTRGRTQLDLHLPYNPHTCRLSGASHFLSLSCGLLKPLLKRKLFHCNLWPAVFNVASLKSNLCGNTKSLPLSPILPNCAKCTIKTGISFFEAANGYEMLQTKMCCGQNWSFMCKHHLR